MLGPLEVLDGDRQVAIGGGRRRALLALLLLHRNEVVPADQLIDALWEGRPPRTAAKGLQIHVSHLRKDLREASPDGQVELLTRARGYVLRVEPDAIDAVRFEHAVADGVRARESGHPRRAAALLREGLALWRGPPLVDFAYEAFARDEIARLEELHLLAIEERIDAELALGHHRELLSELEHLVATHPSRERLRGLLMLALHRCGRRGDALDVYRDGRERSIDELGLEPGKELRALQARILEDDPELAAPPRGPAPTRRRPALALIAASLLLAAAAGAALILQDRRLVVVDRPVADLAGNAIATLGADGRPAFALDLPARPADIAARGDRAYAVTRDAPALTILDGRARRVTSSTPLPIRPVAVAARRDAVWIVDAGGGLALRLNRHGTRIAARATWRRTAGQRLGAAAIAVTARHAWIADGSARLIRAGDDGAVRTAALPRPADGVVASAGAVWALSRQPPAVMRVDARAGRVTDVVPVPGGRGSSAAAPIAIAAGATSVWVLSADTATLSRIDARLKRVTATRRLRRGARPEDLGVGGNAVWVACRDGSVVRLPEEGGRARTTAAGGSLVGVAASGRRAWVAAAASSSNR